MKEILLDYTQHREILAAIVFIGLANDLGTDEEKVERAEKIVDLISGEAEFKP